MISSQASHWSRLRKKNLCKTQLHKMHLRTTHLRKMHQRNPHLMVLDKTLWKTDFRKIGTVSSGEPNICINVVAKKLDGVGPADNRPSTD